MAETPAHLGRGSEDPFGSTQWSVVLVAGGAGAAARAAMATLCQTYWLPVYGFVRSRTRDPDQAVDLVQAFFADVLERETIAAASPERGRFRAFLLTAVRNFLASQHAHQTAQKRGGGVTIVSLDRDLAETALQTVRSTERTPEQEFERRWALTLLQQVMEQLADEHNTPERKQQFSVLRPCLTGEPDALSQQQLAVELGTTPEAVRATVYRLRKRYRSLLREAVARTVGAAEDIDDELRRLISAVSS